MTNPIYPHEPPKALAAPPQTSGWLMVVLGVVPVILGLAGMCGLLGFSMVVMEGGRESTVNAIFGASIVALVLAGGLLVALIGQWMRWIGRAWAWLPESRQRSRHFRGSITPSQAMWRLVIPVYGWYWFIVVEEGLLDAIVDMQRERLPPGAAAPIPRHFMFGAFTAMVVLPFPPLFAISYVQHQRLVRNAMLQLAATNV